MLGNNKFSYKKNEIADFRFNSCISTFLSLIFTVFDTHITQNEITSRTTSRQTKN